jgi:hypothetical protein
MDRERFQSGIKIPSQLTAVPLEALFQIPAAASFDALKTAAGCTKASSSLKLPKKRNLKRTGTEFSDETLGRVDTTWQTPEIECTSIRRVCTRPKIPYQAK